MAILNIQVNELGQSGISPRIIRIETNSTRAEVTAAGFLNEAVDKGLVSLLPSDIALITTKTSPSATAVATDWYDIEFSGGNWSLAATNSTISLTDGDILVGNASNIAQGVTMSGDITISNTGVTAIASGAIVNADVNASAAIDFSKLAALSSGNMLVGNGSNVATSVTMSGDATLSNAGVITLGTVDVAKGGSGRTSATAYAVLCGGTSGSNPHQDIGSTGTSGQVLTSNGTGALPSWQAAGGGGGGWTWNDTTGTSQSMSVDNAYIANNSSLITFTLPSTAAVGERVKVVGYETGLWKIAQNANQIVYINGDATDLGTGGSITSTARGNSITLVCVVANDEWVAETVQGTLTIV